MGVFFPTVAMGEPFDGIRFIVLTDGTVYENRLYRCNRRLSADDYTAIFNNLTPLLCGNLPDDVGKYR